MDYEGKVQHYPKSGSTRGVMKPIDWVPDTTGVSGSNWRSRHLTSVRTPHGPEKPIIGLLAGWLGYAEAHASRYGSGIGDDGVLGTEWAAIGAAIRGLLNGATGSLDCGTLDTIVYDNLKEQGFNPDML